MPLILLPNSFADDQSPHLLLPEGLSELVATLDGLIAESDRAGRRYLIRRKSPRARDLPIDLLNEHSSQADYARLVEKICSEERTFGLISDAGLPAIADPGSHLVALLRQKGYSAIQAIPGPSSLILALMLSGFNGQQFTVHGYLPKEPAERRARIRAIERSGGTHLFIEAPYRNGALLHDLLSTLQERTELCIAINLTLPNQSVLALPVRMWKARAYTITKDPAVFLIQA